MFPNSAGLSSLARGPQASHASSASHAAHICHVTKLQRLFRPIPAPLALPQIETWQRAAPVLFNITESRSSEGCPAAGCSHLLPKAGLTPRSERVARALIQPRCAHHLYTKLTTPRGMGCERRPRLPAAGCSPATLPEPPPPLLSGVLRKHPRATSLRANRCVLPSLTQFALYRTQVVSLLSTPNTRNVPNSYFLVTGRTITTSATPHVHTQPYRWYMCTYTKRSPSSTTSVACMPRQLHTQHGVPAPHTM